MSRSTPRLARGLVLVLLGALASAVVALTPSAANAMCRTSGVVCGIPQHIDFPAVDDVRLDQGPVTLHAVAIVNQVARVRQSWVPPQASTVYYTSETPAVCTISGTRAVLRSAGTCTVVAHADANEIGYPVEAADPQTQGFQVLPAPAGLTLSAPAGAPLSARHVTVSTTSGAGGAVAITSRSAKVCRVTGATVILAAPGTCRLAASQGAASATASFPVWGFPSLPAEARTTEVLPVLGKGEERYAVAASPADVCRVADGAVVLIDGGTCRVTVRSAGHVVRTDRVQVVVPARPAATPTTMDLGATVYFGFDSARLTRQGKAVLRRAASTLREADLVVVYGHTYGPGKNSKHSRALAARRAAAVVACLDDLGVRSKAVTEVAMAMRQPVSKTAWKNRRAEVYFR